MLIIQGDYHWAVLRKEPHILGHACQLAQSIPITMAFPQNNHDLCHAVVISTGLLKRLLLQPTQSGIEQLECHGHPIRRIQSIQDPGHMEITILINHLGVVSSHELQRHEHCFLNLSSIMSPLQGLFHLTAPISIRDGIFLSGLIKQGKA